MIFHIKQPQVKRKKWPYILFGIFLFLASSAFGAYYFFQHIGLEGLLSSRFLQNQITQHVGKTEGNIFELLPSALGFDAPKTYLVLFLNNTELRPGGGFIGVYATIQLDKGKMNVLKVEGTELLDNSSSKIDVPVPPAPLANYLNVKGWYFRDSNWSPDFRESSKESLALYARENGVASQHIDAVIGVTATVLEELMKKTGPLTVSGITFTPENVVAELEKEVEYTFADRGIERSDRKDIIEPLLHAIVGKLSNDALTHLTQYKTLVENLITRKHIVVYATDPQMQETLHSDSLDGSMAETNGDYILWADANLGALKTDHAITRTLSYAISPKVSTSGERYYEARVSMKYVHTSPFDWRTSRYRTYARVFVPTGSELISSEGSMKIDRSIEPGVVSQGVENGKEWFGTFISVEPLTTKTLTFVYRLPKSIADQIDKKTYTLLVQKQIGLVGASLTLNLDFGTTIQSATPAEATTEWGNTTYVLNAPLDSDQMFEVHL